MTDLYVGLACISVISAALFFGGAVLARRMHRRVSIFLMALLLTGLIVFLESDGDRLWLARLLPFSSFIIVGNITLPLVALLSGMAFTQMPGSAGRRCVLVIPLLLAAAAFVIRPMTGSPPRLGQFSFNGVCRQTSSDSCSPAAAATLLHAYQIYASERELADLCLTRVGGTSMAGVFRGLCIKTAGKPIRPQPFHCDLQSLRKTLDGPVLLTVGLEPGAIVDPRYEKQWGWAPGVRHTIVLFRFLPNDRIEVGDPAAGREIWSVEALKVLWHGNGIKLVRRN